MLVDVGGCRWRVDDVALEEGTRRIRRQPDVATHRLFTTREGAHAWKLRVAHPFARRLPTTFPFELLGAAGADGQVTAQLLHRQLRWALHYSPRATAASGNATLSTTPCLRCIPRIALPDPACRFPNVSREAGAVPAEVTRTTLDGAAGARALGASYRHAARCTRTGCRVIWPTRAYARRQAVAT
jgi:hypothetical protein